MKKALTFLVAVAGIVGAFVFLRSKAPADRNGQRIDAATVDGLKRFSETVASTRTAVTDAFGASGETSHDAVDERALTGIKNVADVFLEIREAMPAVAVGLAREIVDRYESAQLQLMSIAINRKNRGSDGTPTDMEKNDLASFTSDIASLSARLDDAITSRRL